MVSKVITLLVMVGAGVAQAANLDLTPIPHLSPIEGGQVEDFAFRNGTDIVIFQAPPRWQASGDATHATFRPALPGAEITISARPKPQSSSFDEDTLKALKAELLASLPRDAARAEWGDDQPSLVRLNRHDTYRIELAYSSSNQRFKTTVVYCNFAAQQLRFQLTCRETDYNDLYTGFKVSVSSLQGLQ
jgi:hypothetical protein